MGLLYAPRKVFDKSDADNQTIEETKNDIYQDDDGVDRNAIVNNHSLNIKKEWQCVFDNGTVER